MFFVPLVSAILFYYALFYYALFFPFLLFQDDTIVRSFLCPSSFALFLRPVPCFASFFFFRTIPSSALSLPSVRRPPFASAKIGGSGGASVPLFPLPSLPFPLSTFRASLREPIVPIAALLCPLRRDLIPTKTPPNPLSIPKISLF